MSKIKAKKILSGGLGIIKDSAETLAETVSPKELVKHAIEGPQKKAHQEDEYSKYLKELGKNISPEKLEELSEKGKLEKEKARQVIRAATPAHMRPKAKPKEERVYDKNWRERQEDEKRKIAESKKQVFIEPKGSSKQPGLPGKGKKPKKTMETKDLPDSAA